MKKIFIFLTLLFSGCFGLGFIVSKLEKKKDWVEGHKPYGVYEKHIKRPLDFAVVVFTFILFWPILLVIAIVVRINMGSPVVFSQERPGLGGEVFTVKKFRTMTDERDSDGELLPDNQRLTQFGKLLRTSSGDEFLEAFNVLSGEMSLIGPRPLLVRYLPYYTEKEKHRHDVRPGLTGLAQVNGRNLVKWDQRLEYDVQYVNKITFWGDMKIFLKTIEKVFKREDVLQDTESDDEGYLDEIREVGNIDE